MNRRRIRIIDQGTTFVVRGWRGGDLAREAGCRPVYSGAAQGWLLDAEHLPTLVAYLQHRNVPVDVETEGPVDAR